MKVIKWMNNLFKKNAEAHIDKEVMDLRTIFRIDVKKDLVVLKIMTVTVKLIVIFVLDYVPIKKLNLNFVLSGVIDYY